MSNSNSSKQVLLSVIGIAILVVAVVGVAFAFFNYTRTGSSNTIKVGRISFVSRQTNTINLTNLFPIDPTNTSDMNDSTKVGTVEIEIEGDTDYANGVEYLVSAVDSSITTNGKVLPISLDINVTSLGTEITSYWTARESKNATIYKKLVGETLEGNQQILVGYIKPNTTSGTAEGVDGSITIKAYLDKNKIAISDTYNGSESDNMGTTTNWVNDRVVLTTNEWNALQNSGVSFKIKVEANEGIWVDEIIKAYDKITENVDSETLINFADKSSSSNGEGLYILPGTENDTNPIYYYRGAINNNNVIFGDYCWQMVRTTNTGGIKMIYNGVPNITGTGDNISYNCGTTREIQDDVRTTTSLQYSTGYYYADDYEIVSSTGNGVTYRLKSRTNPITQVVIANTSDASANIPTIVANYPYTCKKITDTGTCTILYKVDSYASGTKANVYASTDIGAIQKSRFNSSYSSTSDMGYMSNTRYEYGISGWVTGALFASEATWVTDHYELTDASVTTPNATHHYSCNATTPDATCTSLRYVYYLSGESKYYITLANGEIVEDAIYKMTGNIVNPNIDVVTRNQGYVLNNTDSIIKIAIENWFRTNLTNEVDSTKRNYAGYIEDTVYCNDRSLKTASGNSSYPTYQESGWNPNGGDLTKKLYFGTFNRFKNNWYSTSNVPSTICPNETDRFSVSSSIAHLNYPVGLLTADEIIMVGAAGNLSGSYASHYLYTGDYHWSLSPYSFSNNSTNEFAADSNGYLSNDFVDSFSSLRPVVSLKHSTEFETGGDGTPTNPYVVKYE